MITETDFFLVFGGFFSSPGRSVSAPTPILALMNGCSFMQEGRTDLKIPVWSPSAKDQGKMRAEGPLHKLSTSATMLHTQKWVCALEWYIYKEIQYQPYFPMAVMTNICPSPFHARNWEKLPSDLATGRHWGTWSSPNSLVQERRVCCKEDVKLRDCFLRGTPAVQWERSGWISDKVIERRAAIFVSYMYILCCCNFL